MCIFKKGDVFVLKLHCNWFSQVGSKRMHDSVFKKGTLVTFLTSSDEFIVEHVKSNSSIYDDTFKQLWPVLVEGNLTCFTFSSYWGSKGSLNEQDRIRILISERFKAWMSEIFEALP